MAGRLARASSNLREGRGEGNAHQLGGPAAAAGSGPTGWSVRGAAAAAAEDKVCRCSTAALNNAFTHRLSAPSISASDTATGAAARSTGQGLRERHGRAATLAHSHRGHVHPPTHPPLARLLNLPRRQVDALDQRDAGIDPLPDVAAPPARKVQQGARALCKPAQRRVRRKRALAQHPHRAVRRCHCCSCGGACCGRRLEAGRAQGAGCQRA